MDGTPIHLACDRWTSIFLRKFTPVIQDYFEGLYSDAISVAKSKGYKNYTFVDGLFQKWCRNIQNEWTLKERDTQIDKLRKEYQKLETLITYVLSTTLAVMSVVRVSDVTEIEPPQLNLEKFVHTCYWNVARLVAFPYCLYFNKNVVDSERPKCHRKAKDLIEETLKDTISEYLQPELDALSEKKKKRKEKRRKRSDKKGKDISQLTEENLRRFSEEQDIERLKKMEEFKASLRDEITEQDSASRVFVRMNGIEEQPIQEVENFQGEPSPNYMPDDEKVPIVFGDEDETEEVRAMLPKPEPIPNLDVPLKQLETRIAPHVRSLKDAQPKAPSEQVIPLPVVKESPKERDSPKHVTITPVIANSKKGGMSIKLADNTPKIVFGTEQPTPKNIPEPKQPTPARSLVSEIKATIGQVKQGTPKGILEPKQPTPKSASEPKQPPVQLKNGPALKMPSTAQKLIATQPNTGLVAGPKLQDTPKATTERKDDINKIKSVGSVFSESFFKTGSDFMF